MKLKRTSFIIATLIFGCLSTTASYAKFDPNNPSAYYVQTVEDGGIGGNGSHEEWNDDASDITRQALPWYLGGDDMSGDVTGAIPTENDIRAHDLINNYKAKLKAANEFRVTETTTVNSGARSTVTNRNYVVEGDNMYMKMSVTTMTNGAVTDQSTGEGYMVRDGNIAKKYAIKSTGIDKAEGVFHDLREGTFPVNYHGDEVVTLVNGEYIVKGTLTPDDYRKFSANNGKTNTCTVPYELRFNALTGDLTSMTLDMSSTMSTAMGTTATAIYTGYITIDPNARVVIPASIG